MEANIINGHSEDNEFLSVQLISLFEYCLNSHKSVYFQISTAYNLYDVTVDYMNDSYGQYRNDNYDLRLHVTIQILDSNIPKYDSMWYDTLYINNDDYTILDAVEVFTKNYLTLKGLKRSFASETDN